MKKLLGILLLVMTTLFFTACDNNEGPFEIKRENGHKVLYSNGKLAKGMIQNTWKDFTSGETVIVSEYYVEKGIPMGNFNLYDQSGNLVLTFKGNVKNELFIGEMLLADSGKATGEFNLNPDWILGYDGSYEYVKNAQSLPIAVLFNGNAEANFEKVTMNNGRRDGVNTIYSKKGDISKEKFYNNGYLMKEINYYSDGIATTEYHENGRLKSQEVKLFTGVIMKYFYFDENGKRQGELIERNEDGTLHQLIYYEDGKIIGDVFIDSTKNSYIKHGIYEKKSFDELYKEYNQIPKN